MVTNNFYMRNSKLYIVFTVTHLRRSLPHLLLIGDHKSLRLVTFSFEYDLNQKHLDEFDGSIAKCGKR